MASYTKHLLPQGVMLVITMMSKNCYPLARKRIYYITKIDNSYSAVMSDWVQYLCSSSR